MKTIQKTFTTLALALTLTGSLAHANPTNNEVNTIEASNALIQCAGPALSLLRPDNAYISKVVGEYTQISDRVNSKAYIFTSQVGGAFGGPPAETVAVLTATVTITHSDYAAPSSVIWKCDLSNR
ncbi:MAG: hypothetical protein WA160_06460 [Pseudobdellovibrio sp.]